MKAFGKILGLVFLGLLLIIVALGFALTHWFDPNNYKDEIRKLARERGHVELTLKGDIGWSLFPWLGLELHDASIASLAKPDEPFADLQMLGLSVRVLPLLRRQVQMSDIRLEGLNLHLNRDANGHGNWEDIGKAPLNNAPVAPNPPVAGDLPAAPPVAANTEKTSQPVRWDIDSLTVNNAHIDYFDTRSGRQFSAESIQLSTEAIHEGVDIPVKLTAFVGTNQPLMRVRTELQGELRFDRKLKRYQFEDLKLAGEATGDPLADKTLTFAAQGQLSYDGVAQVAQWGGLKVSANQIRALGELNLRDLDKTPQLSGGLSIAQFNLRDFLDGIGQPIPTTANATALSAVEMVARLSATPSSLALEDLRLKLDTANFSGRLAVDDFAKQAVRVQLKGDTLDLDGYLPPHSQEDESARISRQNSVNDTLAAAGKGDSPLPDAPGKTAWSDTSVLPIERLRSLDLQLDLGLDKLTIDKLPIENALLKAGALGGVIDLQNLRGDLHDGNFQATGQIDARPDVPLISLAPHLSRIPVDSVLEARGQKPPVKGALDLDADLKTSGVSQKAWADGLNGTASFALNDGVLVDANLEQQLCQGVAVINRKTLSGEPRSLDTPFQELKGSLTFNNGVASNPDLKARIPGLSVNGNGTLDLRVLGMDYQLGVLVQGDKSAMPDPACEVNPRLAEIEWPVRCRGPMELGAKACRVDREELGKIAAKLAGDKLSEKLDEKLGDKVSPELKDALKGLFKR